MTDLPVTRVIRSLSLGLFLLLLVCGCRSILREEEGEGGDGLPWNSPAGWENQVIGVPY